jgi:gamma-butyrobetaine dioxygenase
MPGLTVTSHSEVGLTVADDASQTVELHAIWLRDACSCVDCRRPTTNERLLDSTTIPLDLTITSFHHDDDRLTITTSDRHLVVITVDWLACHIAATDRRERPAGDAQLGDLSAGSSMSTFERSAIDACDGLRDCLDAVIHSGAALVRNVPATERGLCDVAALIGEILPTNYGATWTIEADIAPVTAVDSERHLLVHTDLPYRTAVPGVQLLLAVITDVTGGATTLVDGYAVAESLRHRDRDAWQILTEVEFAYPFIRDDFEFVGRAPVIGLHRDGSYHQIRRAPDLVGVPYVSAADAPALYRALRIWTEAIDDPDNEFRIPLEPGNLLIFHNHRLLHGRTAFELGAHGRRQLIGCYLDYDDLNSRRSIVARLC